MARQSRNYHQSQSRPNRSWSSIISPVAVDIPAATKVLLGHFSPSNVAIDETVLRTVGMLSVASDQVANTEHITGAFGLIVVTEQARAAGVASMPGPATDGTNDGWFVMVQIQQRIVVASGVGFDPNSALHYAFDSKAKRIVEDGENIAIIVENFSATAGFRVGIGFRLLSQVRGTR